MTRRALKIFFAAVTVALALASCRKEPDIPELPKQPEGYQELLTAYNAGLEFKNCKIENGISTVSFYGGSTIKIRLTDLRIHNCRSTKPASVSLDSGTGMWLINGINCGIKDHSRLSNEQAAPVYIYFDQKTLYMYISNGNLLEFPTKEPGGDLEPKKFTMPIVRITHTSDRVHRSYYIPAKIIIDDPDKVYSDVEKLSSEMQIRGRGQSTWDMDKKPYRIKLNEEQKVLGMPKNKDWCLLANYADKSLLRNSTAMLLSEICDMSWTPRHVPVEVYLNNTYIGVYDLFEAKEVTKHKVNINLDAGDLYIEIEQNDNEFYTSRCGVPMRIKEPEEHTSAQLTRLKTFANEFETVLYSSYYADPTNGYAKYIDVDSFVDNYIIEELTKDIDGNVRKSSFMTLEAATGKLKFYHQWDFDLTLGNCDYYPGDMNGCSGEPNGPKGWWIRDYNTASTKGDGWYNRLFKDPVFVKKVKDRWNELYDDFSTVPLYIDKWSTEMGDAAGRNFNKWKILNKYVWPNYKIPGSYSGEISWLKQFYTERLEWMNTNLNKL